MPIKAVGFDIGHTLINYNAPLSWKSLYPDVLRKVMDVCQFAEQENWLESAVAVLSKYNTREHYREYEVTSDTIFKEIFDAWGQDYGKLSVAKEVFYEFFQSNAVCFDDTVSTLETLSANGFLLGFLTDVAYGMDNEYSLNDIAEIKHYFNAGFTSVDVGFRKPNAQGFMMLLDALDIQPSQMLFVGDEEKDITGANNVGIVSVLINKDADTKNWGQSHTIQNLSEILNLISSVNERILGT